MEHAAPGIRAACTAVAHCAVCRKVCNIDTSRPIKDIVPLTWDMEQLYGASKGPRQFFGVVGIIELDDFIQDFDMWCDMQLLRSPS